MMMNDESVVCTGLPCLEGACLHSRQTVGPSGMCMHAQKKYCATSRTLQTSMFTVEASQINFMESLGAIDVSFETVLFGVQWYIKYLVIDKGDHLFVQSTTASSDRYWRQREARQGGRRETRGRQVQWTTTTTSTTTTLSSLRLYVQGRRRSRLLP
jgi:hypothetical protein